MVCSSSINHRYYQSPRCNMNQGGVLRKSNGENKPFSISGILPLFRARAIAGDWVKNSGAEPVQAPDRGSLLCHPCLPGRCSLVYCSCAPTRVSLQLNENHSVPPSFLPLHFTLIHWSGTADCSMPVTRYISFSPNNFSWNTHCIELLFWFKASCVWSTINTVPYWRLIMDTLFIYRVRVTFQLGNISRPIGSVRALGLGRLLCLCWPWFKGRNQGWAALFSWRCQQPPTTCVDLKIFF